MAKTIKGRKFVATAATAALVASAIVPVASASTEFKDASKISDWATKAVDFLVAKDVLEGDEAGNFIPQGELTRGQAAKVLALSLELKVDATASSTFADAKGHWSDAYIAAIVASNSEVISGYDADTFRPDAKITRQEFAKMIVTAFKIELDETKEVPAFTDVDEWATKFVQILASQGIVKGLGGTKFGGNDTVTREAAAVFAHRTLVEEVRETVDAKPSTTATKVASVTATNLKEVVVTFDGTVDKETAQEKGNYALKSGKAIKAATLLEDSKTVVLTLADGVTLNNNRAEALSVSNVKAGDKTVSVSNVEFKVFDNEIPVVSTVTSLGTKAVKVTFSEPIKEPKQANFTLDGKAFYGKVTVVGNAVVLTPYSSSSLAVGDHSLQITKVEDFAGFTSLTTTKDFTVVEDKDAPTVTETTATLESLTVTFSEDVDPETISASKVYWKSGDTKKTADSVETLAGNKYRYIFSGDKSLPTGSVPVYVEGVKDYSGNEIAKDTKVVVTPEIDQTRPEVKKVEVANSKKVEITFSKVLENDSATNKNNYVFLNKDGKVISVQDVTLSADKKTVTVSLYTALSTGKNTLTVKNVKDATKLQNTMLDYSADLTVADGAAPKIDSTVWSNSDRRVVVKFNEKMDIETLTNYSNYHIVVKGENRALTSAIADIEPYQDGSAVVITFVEKIGNLDVEFGSGSIEKLQLLALKDTSGNILEEYQKNQGKNIIDFTSAISFGFGEYDSYSSTVYNAALVDRKTVEIKFSFPINDVQKDAIKVASGTNEIDSIEVNGTSTVKVKFKTNFATDATDVDLDVDFTKLVTLAGDKATGSGTIKKSNTSDAGKLLDQVAPTVNTNEKYTVNSATKKITVPFTEALSLNGTGAVAAQDFKVTRVTDNKELKAGVDYTVALTNSDKDVEIQIIAADSTIDGSLYVVEVVSNAKYISDTSDAKNYITATSGRETTGKIDQVVPVISSASYTDVDKDNTASAGDKVEITFSETLKFADGKTAANILADLALSTGDSFGDTASAVLSGNKVIITLGGTGITLSNTSTINVGSASALTDINGNLIVSGTAVEIK